jgi:hypothetical protein
MVSLELPSRNMISMAYLIAGKLKFNKLYAQPM